MAEVLMPFEQSVKRLLEPGEDLLERVYSLLQARAARDDLERDRLVVLAKPTWDSGLVDRANAALGTAEPAAPTFSHTDTQAVTALVAPRRDPAGEAFDPLDAGSPVQVVRYGARLVARIYNPTAAAISSGVHCRLRAGGTDLGVYDAAAQSIAAGGTADFTLAWRGDPAGFGLTPALDFYLWVDDANLQLNATQVRAGMGQAGYAGGYALSTCLLRLRGLVNIFTLTRIWGAGSVITNRSPRDGLISDADQVTGSSPLRALFSRALVTPWIAGLTGLANPPILAVGSTVTDDLTALEYLFIEHLEVGG